MDWFLYDSDLRQERVKYYDLFVDTWKKEGTYVIRKIFWGVLYKH